MSEWTINPPDQGRWYWVTDGKTSWVAMHDYTSAGGWCNEDCWEDWDHKVIAWCPLPNAPEPAAAVAVARAEFAARHSGEARS